MRPRLVASNPDVPAASKAERVVRRLTFADAELKRLAPAAGTPADVELIDTIRQTLRAAVGLLRARQLESEEAS